MPVSVQGNNYTLTVGSMMRPSWRAWTCHICHHGLDSPGNRTNLPNGTCELWRRRSRLRLASTGCRKSPATVIITHYQTMEVAVHQLAGLALT
jgi:hypothetical protein